MADDEKFRVAVHVALGSLPDSLREVFVLKAIEGYTLAEIAVILSIDEDTARARHRQAVERMRDMLQSHGRTEAEAAGDPDLGTAALELAAESLATESTATVLKPEEIRLTPSLVVCDPQVLQYLDRHPESMRNLSPRDFENLIAGMLDRFGYRVELGPKGADGGVDVHATKASETGLEYLVVQCKRYAESNKVSAPVVKQLWADVLHRGASRGLVVTTSWFTREALKYVSLHKHQLDAADFDRIKSWLTQLTRRAA